MRYKSGALAAAAGSAPEGWRTWAPHTYVDTARDRGQPGSLAISGNSNPAEFGAWNRITLEAPAAAQAAAVKLQFYLANAPQGTVWWDDIAFEEIPAPAPRKITVASISLRPRNSKSSEESVRRFIDAIDKAVPGKADIIVLPEGITAIGTGKNYYEGSETVPGLATELLGEAARRRGTHSHADRGRQRDAGKGTRD